MLKRIRSAAINWATGTLRVGCGNQCRVFSAEAISPTLRCPVALSHLPVMLTQVLRVLQPAPGETYADCTAGLGGHAAAVASAISATPWDEVSQSGATIVLGDLDSGNLRHASGAVSQAAMGIRLIGLQGNFAQIPYALESRGMKADMLLADFGFASPQVDDAARGFSFMRDGPLDMRMDQTSPTTAAVLVASMSERELTQMIEEYGEEHQARRIAKKLVQERAHTPILSTTHLAELIRGVVGHRNAGGIDPATRTFQALRIAVNDEIGSINALMAAIAVECRRVIDAAIGSDSDGGSIQKSGRVSGGGIGGRWLRPGARLAFITFHSLEDRPVKQTLSELIKRGAEDLTDGVERADEVEVATNPRSRSAKLRAIKLPG